MMDILTKLQALLPNTMMEYLGITYTVATDGYVEATMPVTPKVHQPMGLLHGGATAALIESVGSGASVMYVDLAQQMPVGIAINVSHLASARKGVVTAKGNIIQKGTSIHVWQVDVYGEDQRHLATGRMTNMIVNT